MFACAKSANAPAVPAKLGPRTRPRCDARSRRASLERLRPAAHGGVISSMQATIRPPPEPDDPALPFWQRLAWFAGLGLAVLLAAAGGAYLLKALLQ